MIPKYYKKCLYIHAQPGAKDDINLVKTKLKCYLYKQTKAPFFITACMSGITALDFKNVVVVSEVDIRVLHVLCLL